jgi:CubicO group peptidase (beta-lactamase class C family)
MPSMARRRRIAAAPETIYHLASLTKPYGSTIFLQLVAERRLGLDAPSPGSGSRWGAAPR